MRPYAPSMTWEDPAPRTRELFLRMIVGEVGIKELVMSDELEVDGSRLVLEKI